KACPGLDPGMATGSREQNASRRAPGERAASSSGSPHVVEKLADLALEAVTVGRQHLRGGQHLGGRRTGLGGAALYVGDVGGHLLRALRGLLHIARDLLRRRALLLDGRSNRR